MNSPVPAWAQIPEQFASRVPYPDLIADTIRTACTQCGLGSPQRLRVFEKGYEDLCLRIDTTDKAVVAKIFAKHRNPEDIERIVAITEAVCSAGVTHPHIYVGNQGALVHSGGNKILLMDLIEGKSLEELGRLPTPSEFRQIIAQAAKIHQVPINPRPIYDSWAIVNLAQTYAGVREFMTPQQQGHIDTVIHRLHRMNLQCLPACFTHGDMHLGNLLSDAQGEIWVIDFSVSNTYPRIHDLAVISLSLFLAGGGDSRLAKITEEVAVAYMTYCSLSESEQAAIYDYSLAGIAALIIGYSQEWFLAGNHSENVKNYQDMGWKGLLRELSPP
jgi:Ser/Thr protein kinase RdoA (MazF antagonist)